MAKYQDVIIAGFGGQGVMLIGNLLAQAGMEHGLEVSFIPVYGAEMRGGTANCSICISKEPIGSPLVVTPNVLVAMNLPSLDKFIDAVEPGGLVLIDSSLIDKKVTRTDVTVCYVPATRMAEEHGFKGLANIILMGRLYAEIPFCSEENLDAGLQKCIPARKAAMLDMNRQAFALGKASKE